MVSRADRIDQPFFYAYYYKSQKHVVTFRQAHEQQSSKICCAGKSVANLFSHLLRAYVLYK